MKTIPLSQGKFALVDDADYEAVSKFKWYAHKRKHTFYAVRHIRKPNGKQTTQYLHQFLMPGVAQIDHRDGNGLNNQKYNLRPATNQQNRQGFRQPKLGATSKFRGVYWNKCDKRWQVQIGVDGKDIYLGQFKSEKDAARARDVATLKYHGKFAQLNFP